MTKPKILVIYTGGTFGMDENLEIPKLSAKALEKRLYQQVPEMEKIADIAVQIVFNTDSCQMGTEHWFTLAHHIHQQGKHYEGIVILHGTDTLAHTAAALSYLLSPSPVPIVITGAQKPLSTLRNDARTNLLTALEVAANAPKELQNRVMVAFHDELFLGSRVRKFSALDFAAFESPRFPRLARVGSSIQFESVIHHLPKLKKGRPMIEGFQTEVLTSPQILKAEVTPEFASAIFSRAVLEQLDAILLTLYPSGTAPTERPDFLRFLKDSKEYHCPILAITERADAPIKLSSYASGKTLMKEGVLWCQDLTPEAALVKIMLLQIQLHKKPELGRKQKAKAIALQWSKPLSDESSI